MTKTAQIISPSGIKTDLNCTEIFSHCQNEIRRLNEKRMINSNEYQSFCEQYHYFKDMSVVEYLLSLGYGLRNDLFTEKQFYFWKGGQLFTRILIDQSEIEIPFPSSSDAFCKIQPIDINSLQNGWLALDGYQFVLEESQTIQHKEVAQMILMNYLLTSPKILEDFIHFKNLFQQTFYAENFFFLESSYLISHLGFSMTVVPRNQNKGMILYNPWIQSLRTREIRNQLFEYHPKEYLFTPFLETMEQQEYEKIKQLRKDMKKLLKL